MRLCCLRSHLLAGCCSRTWGNLFTYLPVPRMLFAHRSAKGRLVPIPPLVSPSRLDLIIDLRTFAVVSPLAGLLQLPFFLFSTQMHGSLLHGRNINGRAGVEAPTLMVVVVVVVGFIMVKCTCFAAAYYPPNAPRLLLYLRLVMRTFPAPMAGGCAGCGRPRQRAP